MSYLKSYINFLETFGKVEKPTKVIVDCSNGPAGAILNGLKVGNLEIIVINGKADGNFPAHGPDPTKPGATNDAKKEILKTRSHFGAVLDSDGDRAVFLDEQGRTLPVYAVLRAILANHRPPFVVDVLVYEALRHSGYSPINNIINSKVGTRFIKDAMKTNDSSVGAEFSGHYYFRAEAKNKKFYIDSAILAIIQMANFISGEKKSLGGFYDSLTAVYQEQINVPANENGVRRLIKKIEKEFYNEKHQKNHLDGVTLGFDDWWLNVRESNTEPILRVSIGAKRKERLGLVKKALAEV